VSGDPPNVPQHPQTPPEPQDAQDPGRSGARQPKPGAQASPAPQGSPQRVSDGTYKRLTSGVGQFGLAIGACLLLVGVIMLLTPRADKETLPQVDARSAAEAMRLTAPYLSYAPQGLPAGWRATSSRLSGDKGAVAWHLGFLTSSDQYAALEESNERPAVDFVRRMTNVDPANPKSLVGTRQVAGASWKEYHREDKRQNSLVRELPTVMLVVTGTASYDELAVLAASLRPQPRPSATP
jgi:hypothetical protein